MVQAWEMPFSFWCFYGRSMLRLLRLSLHCLMVANTWPCTGTSSWSPYFSTGFVLGVDDNPCSVAYILKNIIIIITSWVGWSRPISMPISLDFALGSRPALQSWHAARLRRLSTVACGASPRARGHGPGLVPKAWHRFQTCVNLLTLIWWLIMITRRVVDDDDDVDDDDLVCRFLLCVPVRLIVLGDDRWISVELPGIYHFMDSIIGTQGWKENCWIWWLTDSRLELCWCWLISSIWGGSDARRLGRQMQKERGTAAVQTFHGDFCRFWSGSWELLIHASFIRSWRFGILTAEMGLRMFWELISALPRLEQGCLNKSKTWLAIVTTYDIATGFRNQFWGSAFARRIGQVILLHLMFKTCQDNSFQFFFPQVDPLKFQFQGWPSLFLPAHTKRSVKACRARRSSTLSSASADGMIGTGIAVKKYDRPGRPFKRCPLHLEIYSWDSSQPPTGSPRAPLVF